MPSQARDVVHDIAVIARIAVIPSLLQIICKQTGMGFAAVARVTDDSWTACAVEDQIDFGLKPGDQLELKTTLCVEARETRSPIAFDHASVDPVYSKHHTPRIYKLESYISVPIVHPDGSYFGNLCAIDPRPRSVANALTLAMFQQFADVIAHQLALEDRQAAADDALSSERVTAGLREQFIAVLGHDLRNPLFAVSATAEILLRRYDNKELTVLGERLKRSAKRMAGLIDDMLDFARGRLGSGIAVEYALVEDHPEALESVVDELRVAFPKRLIRYSGPGHPVALRADLGRLQQLLSNMLANALTHGSPDHGVDVVVSVEGQDLVIAVSNRGEPIPAADLPKVFHPYWHRATRGGSSGLGLGLYICSQIAAAHGGSVSVASDEDSGTRFTARLPVVASSGVAEG